MDELNQVLERMQATLAERALKSDISPMQSHGSTSVAGNPTILSQAGVTPISHQFNRLNQIAPVQQSNEHSKKAQPLCNSPECQRQLGEFLLQCYDGLNTYGKTPEQLENASYLFFAVLGEYTYQQIKSAFIQHMKHSSNMPTPADIVNIINPPPPKIDWALYIELKKRLREGNVYVSSDEKKFLSECEIVGVDRQRGEFKGYHEAQGKLEAHKQLMIANDSGW